MKKFLAIGFIWLGCAVAWLILGSTIMVRSGETSGELQNEVYLLWGPPMQQAPPRAVYHELHKKREQATTKDAQGHETVSMVERDDPVEIDIPLAGSDVAARLSLEHRRKGLLWFPTYGVDFHARYTFVNTLARDERFDFRFPLGRDRVVFDGFAVALDGKPVVATVAGGEAQWSDLLRPGERRVYEISYRSRGTTRWGYQLTGANDGEVHDFHLTLDSNFSEINFPAGTLSPSAQHATAEGWHGDWTFRSLVANSPIGLELPQRLNPGPLAERITFFAPVGLLFFFFVVAVLAAARQKRIHARDYFLFGCSFFAFHLLFAYLVDHLSIVPSFAVASLVSIALVTSYTRLFVGWQFALREMGIAQLIYLVLFSFTFFLPGFTGLAVTIGAILTLFVMMQVTGRVKWEKAPDQSSAATVNDKQA